MYLYTFDIDQITDSDSQWKTLIFCKNPSSLTVVGVYRKQRDDVNEPIGGTSYLDLGVPGW